jgi:hypothetical protein
MSAQPIRLTIELENERDPIEGWLRVEHGEAVPFTGWLELMAAVEQVRTRASFESAPGTAERPQG